MLGGRDHVACMWKKWNSHKFVLVTWRHKYPGESCLDDLHIFCPDYHQMLSGFVSGLATFFFRHSRLLLALGNFSSHHEQKQLELKTPLIVTHFLNVFKRFLVFRKSIQQNLFFFLVKSLSFLRGDFNLCSGSECDLI